MPRECHIFAHIASSTTLCLMIRPPRTVDALLTIQPWIAAAVESGLSAVAVSIGAEWLDAFALAFCDGEHAVRASVGGYIADVGCCGSGCGEEGGEEEMEEEWLHDGINYGCCVSGVVCRLSSRSAD